MRLYTMHSLSCSMVLFSLHRCAISGRWEVLFKPTEALRMKTYAIMPYLPGLAAAPNMAAAAAPNMAAAAASNMAAAAAPNMAAAVALKPARPMSQIKNESGLNLSLYIHSKKVLNGGESSLH